MTSTNRFSVPKSFGTHLRHSSEVWQFDSQHHWPSTTNLYSLLPGGKFNSVFQLPLPSVVIGVASIRQSLNVPAKNTTSASGAWQLNFVDFVFRFDIKLFLVTLQEGSSSRVLMISESTWVDFVFATEVMLCFPPSIDCPNQTWQHSKFWRLLNRYSWMPEPILTSCFCCNAISSFAFVLTIVSLAASCLYSPSIRFKAREILLSRALRMVAF